MGIGIEWKHDLLDTTAPDKQGILLEGAGCSRLGQPGWQGTWLGMGSTGLFFLSQQTNAPLCLSPGTGIFRIYNNQCGQMIADRDLMQITQSNSICAGVTGVVLCCWSRFGQSSRPPGEATTCTVSVNPETGFGRWMMLRLERNKRGT